MLYHNFHLKTVHTYMAQVQICYNVRIRKTTSLDKGYLLTYTVGKMMCCNGIRAFANVVHGYNSDTHIDTPIQAYCHFKLRLIGHKVFRRRHYDYSFVMGDAITASL